MKANWGKKICTVLLSFMMVVVMTPTSAIAAATEEVPSQDQPAAAAEVKSEEQAVKDAQPEEKTAEESAEKPAEEKADESAEQSAETKADESAEQSAETKADSAPAEAQGDAAKAADAAGKVSYPAMTLTAKAGGVTVTLKAPEGSLPEGAKLNAKQVGQKYIDAVESKLEAQGRELTDAVAVDVTPVDKNGKEIQPKKAVTVTFTGAGLDLESGDSVDVFRVSDDAATVTDMNGSGSADKQTFKTNHFTIYVAGTTEQHSSTSNRYVLYYGESVTLETSHNNNLNASYWSVTAGSQYVTYAGGSSAKYYVVTNNNTSNTDRNVTVQWKRTNQGNGEPFYITAKARQYVTFMVRNAGASSFTQKDRLVITNGSVTPPTCESPVVVNGKKYVFDGWYSNQACTNKDDTFTGLTTNKTVYGRYTEVPTVTFMYKAPGETTFTQEAMLDIEDGSVTPPEHPETTTVGNTTYVYSEWCTDQTCETPVSSFDNLTASMTVYSKYTAQRTVTFYLKDAGESRYAQLGDAQTVLDGGDATVPGEDVTPATKTVGDREYAFSGWYTDDTFTTQATFTNITDDMDVYAKYDPIVKLTYKKNSGTDAATVPGEEEEPAGTTIQLGTATREGYAFLSWNTKKDGSGDSYGAGIEYDLPEEDTVFYAQWTEVMVDVVYHNNYDGATEDVFHTDENVAGNNPHYTIIEDMPYRTDGYLFAGWSTEQGGIAQYGPKDYYNTGSEDEDLYAVWVKFDKDLLVDGYTELTANGEELYYDGDEHTISDVKENDIDYGTPDHDKKRKYGDEGYVKVSTVALSQTQHNIYAKVDEITATGTDAGSYNTPLTASLYTHTNNPSSFIPVNAGIPVKNHTLTIMPVEMTVDTVGARKLYDGNPLTADGTVTLVDTNPQPFTPEGSSVNLVNDETISIKATGSQTEEGKSNNTYEIDWSNSTAEKVNYKVNEGTIGELEVYKIPVSYKPNAGGDTVKDMPEDTRIGKEVFSLPEKTPSREHYKFLGWGLTADQKTDLLQPGDPYEFSEETESITFYAIWEAKTYTLTFDPNGGTFRGATSQYVVEYKYGETITIPEAPTREGYEFVCWRGSEYQPGDTYLVEGNHIFTAEWEAVEADDTDDDSDSTSVKTGDEHNVFVWITVMLAAIAALAVMAVRRRKLDK